MNSRYKYNISINVVPVIEHKLDLDYIDLIIFDFIKDFANSNNCTKIQTNEGLYFWISHTSIMNQLPLLKITSKAGVIKRIDNLINAGILEKSKQSQEFGKSLYRFGKNYDKMIFSDSKPKKSGTNKSLEGYQRELGGGTNGSLEDNNNIDNIDNYNKEEESDFVEFDGLKYPKSHIEHSRSVISNEISLQTFMQQNSIKNIDGVKSLLMEFNKHLNIDGKRYEASKFKDYRQHFVNWCRRISSEDINSLKSTKKGQKLPDGVQPAEWLS